MTAIARPADATGQIAVAAALVATLATNTLANVLPLNGQNTGEISDRYPVLITPPGYVFGVWGLIYSGLIGYAIYQALPAQRHNERLRAIAWPFVLSCAANIVWLLLWHYNHPRLTLGAMVGLLLALITIDMRLGRVRGGRLGELLLARLPFSIYLGWISVATIVNVAVALYDAGWRDLGTGGEAWTAGLLGVGGALGAGMGFGRGDAAYPLVLAWAFVGIARQQVERPLVAGSAWASTALVLAAALGALWRAQRTTNARM